MTTLAAYTGEARSADAVETALAPLQPALAQAPTGFAGWLCALDFVLTPPQEIVIVGDDAQPLLDVVFGEYRPNQVVAWKKENAASEIPLLEGRDISDGKATAYVSQNFVCQMPVMTREALVMQMNK